MDDPERMFWIELSYRYSTPVSILQEIISSQHFVELVAAERVCPRGEIRADMRAGIVASVVANANRGKGVKAFTPADFMPEFGVSEKEKKRRVMENTRKRMMALVGQQHRKEK